MFTNTATGYQPERGLKNEENYQKPHALQFNAIYSNF